MRPIQKAFGQRVAGGCPCALESEGEVFEIARPCALPLARAGARPMFLAEVNGATQPSAQKERNMPRLSIERSIEIAAPPEKVFAVVSDLGAWRPWNPWLITEPDAKVEVRGDHKQYSWRGKRTGAGEMRVVAEDDGRRVDLALTFFKPFKSHAQVSLFVEPRGAGSRVRWTMESRLPVFMAFFAGAMRTMIGMDYDRGLAMLKDLLECGAIPSKVEQTGVETSPGCRYVGITSRCATGEIGPTMTRDFAKLERWRAEFGVELVGEPFAVYRKWNLSKGQAAFTSGLPVARSPSELPEGFESGELPSLRTYVLTHVGAYRHLGNAWSTGMQMVRGKELMTSRKHPPFERYLDSPKSVDEKELRVAIHFPVK